MSVTNVLRTQCGRVWLRQNVGIVGTPCVVRRPRLAPTILLPPARATQASPPRTTLPPPLRIRSGFRGDVTQWLTTCKAGDADRLVRRRFRGNVKQWLPVKARHSRLRWSRWARVTNGPRSLFTATSARQGNSALPGLSARDHLHLGGGSAGGRD